MSDVLSTPDASVSPLPATGGRTTKVHERIVHVAPDSAMLLDVRTVSSLLGCSERHVYRLSDAGRMPSPVKLGSLVRWSASAIQEWIKGGCRPVRQLKGGA